MDPGRIRRRAHTRHGVHGHGHQGGRARRVPAVFDVAAIGAQDIWAPLLAALAAITIIVGNAGALGSRR